MLDTYLYLHLYEYVQQVRDISKTAPVRRAVTRLIPGTRDLNLKQTNPGLTDGG